MNLRGIFHQKNQKDLRILSTSLSDNQLYPNVCLQAANDYRVFNSFRRDPYYNEILEHVNFAQGTTYLDLIQKNPELFRFMETFKENDRWGNPITFEYAGIGTISPTTLRYIKVLADLLDEFGDLQNLKIAEIGVGYGGQCRIIDCFSRPSSYTLIDIKPALMLTQRYLDNFALHSVVSYMTMNELDIREYDLVISNYALTELPRTIQDVYMKKVIADTPCGYITYNEITPPDFHSYKKDELVEILPKAKIQPEVPLTSPLNCIITWNR